MPPTDEAELPANDPTDETLAEIERAAFQAIAGGEYVREKLAALTTMGPAPLYDEVYAIKLRVKNVRTLVRKVLKKRYRENKPDYQPSSATDIVGMRLLSLFASDIPRITRSVVGFLIFCQSPHIGIIHGDTLNDAIEEVKVYRSRQMRGAAIYDRVYRYFKSQPLDVRKLDGTPKVDLVDFPTGQKSYSSVHVVVRAISYVDGTPKVVPLELQVRSIFEDAWGEIDHRLEYKFEEDLNESQRAQLPFYKHFQEMLRHLKDKLEDVGSDAEIIRDGYEDIVERLSRTLPGRNQEIGPFLLSPVDSSDDYERHLNLDAGRALGQGIARAVQSVIERAPSLREQIGAPIYDRKAAEKIIASIEEYVEALTQGEGEASEPSVLESEAGRKFLYLLSMEKALCYVWSYQLSDHFFQGNIEHNVQYLDAAIDVYLKLEKQRIVPKDAFLNFRLGSALLERGRRDGEEILELANDQVETDKRVMSSLFAALIPHRLAHVIWMRRAGLLLSGFRVNNPRIYRDGQIEAVGRALQLELRAKRRLVNFGRPTQGMEARAHRTVANNIVSYVWELRDLMKTEEEFNASLFAVAAKEDARAGAGGAHLRALLELRACGELVRGMVQEDGADAAGVDTCMKFAQLAGDNEACGGYLRDIEQIIARAKQGKANRNVDVAFLQYSVDQVRNKGRAYELAKEIV